MHGRENYPLHKERSDLDIALPNGCNDREYLDTLRNALPRIMNEFMPDFVFYLSGVDILATDKLGKLDISREGCLERDRFVFLQCKEKKIPVVAAMGGGYSPRISDIVEAHCNTFRAAANIFF
jgi:acetoin utilization deacetylase AcuC-like enzyme